MLRPWNPGTVVFNSKTSVDVNRFSIRTGFTESDFVKVRLDDQSGFKVYAFKWLSFSDLR